jgi:putative endonuclease
LSTEVDKRVETGQIGESIAASYLQRTLGWTILHRNWRCYRGELDIIALHSRTLVMVEVRTKRSERFGTLAEAITYRKLKQVRRVAEYFLTVEAARFEHCAMRFDVVLVGLKRRQVIDFSHLTNVLS